MRLSWISSSQVNLVNATTITLIPKTKSPENVNDFHPISCCNTIYKCISKMLCNRLRRVLPTIVDEAQCAFVEGRKSSKMC